MGVQWWASALTVVVASVGVADAAGAPRNVRPAAAIEEAKIIPSRVGVLVTEHSVS